MKKITELKFSTYIQIGLFIYLLSNAIIKQQSWHPYRNSIMIICVCIIFLDLYEIQIIDYCVKLQTQIKNKLKKDYFI